MATKPAGWGPVYNHPSNKTSLMIHNTDPNSNTRHVGCNQFHFLEWCDGQSEWIYTNRVKFGCIAIAIVSAKGCYLSHWLQSFPTPAQGWVQNIVAMVKGYYREHAASLGGGRLFILAPLEQDRAGSQDGDEKLARTFVKMIGASLESETNIKPTYMTYDSRLCKDISDYSVLEINRDVNKVVKVWLNCQPW